MKTNFLIRTLLVTSSTISALSAQAKYSADSADIYTRFSIGVVKHHDQTNYNLSEHLKKENINFIYDQQQLNAAIAAFQGEEEHVIPFLQLEKIKKQSPVLSVSTKTTHEQGVIKKQDPLNVDYIFPVSFMGSLAVGINISENFAAELEYSYIHTLTSEKTYKGSSTVEADIAGKPAPEDAHDANSPYIKYISCNFPFESNITTKLEKKLHTMLVNGVIKHQINSMELRGTLGVGFAHVDIKGTIKTKPTQTHEFDYISDDPLSEGWIEKLKITNKKQEYETNFSSSKGFHMALSAGAQLMMPLQDNVNFVTGYKYYYIPKIDGLDNQLHTFSAGVEFCL